MPLQVKTRRHPHLSLSPSEFRELDSSVSALSIPPTLMPKLNCRFKIERSGAPKSFRAEGLNNYDIEIFVTDLPENARTVTYYLDDSYGDESIFTKRTADKNFLETIESYGDFELIAMVELSGNREPMVIHRKLSDALREWHQNNSELTEAIRKAIEDVQRN